jgi:cobalt-zinc-cadmium efflux system membrane fusion protein
MEHRTLLTLAALVFPALTGCHQKDASAGEAPAASAGTVSVSPALLESDKIEVSTVAERDVDNAVTTSGRVTFEDLKVAHVVSPVSGRVVELKAALGQRVKKGDTLATIRSPDIGQVSADLAKAKAELAAAEHNYNRKRDLFAAEATSASDYEAAEDTYRQAKAEKDRAEQKARLLRSGRLDGVTQWYSISSPIDGEVIARDVNPGAELQGEYSNGTSAPLFTVGELDRVWVMADVYEVDVARVAVGARVRVSVMAYPDVTFEGKVDWVPGTLDPTSHTMRVRCTFENPERQLKPEMYATVQISVPGRNNLVVPRSAVVRLGEQQVVFVQHEAHDGTFHFERTPVEVDDLGGERSLVRVDYGLETGMRVVTNGAQAIAGMM